MRRRGLAAASTAARSLLTTQYDEWMDYRLYRYGPPEVMAAMARGEDDNLSRRYILRILPSISMAITLYISCLKIRQDE